MHNSKGTLLLLLALLSLAASLKYCEVEDSNVNLFATSQEVQQILLSKHFRGYDLDYQSSNPSIMDVYEPYHVTQELPLSLQAGYLPINIDSKNSKDNLWGRDGVVVTQSNGKSIGIGYGTFKNDVLPTINFTYFTLPSDAKCYSGRIYNNDMSVVLDCESEDEDLLCLLSSDGSQQCETYDSITQTGNRISLIHTTPSNNKYLLSAASSRHINAKFVNETFINIYHIRENSRADFNLIVDRRALGLDSLSITDMDLIELSGITYVLVADAGGWLVMFRYMPDNTIADVKTFEVEGSPMQVEVTPYSEIIVATDKGLLVYVYTAQGTIALGRKYEVDPSDNDVTDIQSSFNHITVRTSLNNIYTYDRMEPSLKFLLNRESVSVQTAIAVSPFFPRTFSVNGTHMRSVAITSGYLYVGKLTADTNVTVTASSGSLQCKIDFIIRLVNDPAKIYNKKDIQASIRFENEDALDFKLNDYFVGSNMRYAIQANPNKDITYDLQHFKLFQHSALHQDDEVDLTRIVEIDASSYWFITFSPQAVRFWVCTTSNSSTNCKEDVNSKVVGNGKHVTMAESGRREDGSLMVAWTFDAPQLNFKVPGKGGVSMIFTYDNSYSKILVGKKSIALVEKTMNRLNFLDHDKLYTFSKMDFSPEEMELMGGGFYPRDIYADPNNPYLFYVKFPVSIVTIAYMGKGQIEIISKIQVSKTYVPDSQWDVVFGSETLLLFTPGKVSEYVLTPDSNLQILHDIGVDGEVQLPVTYQHSTNTAFFTTGASLQFIRLHQNSLDSQYYRIPVEGENGGDWSISESWLYLPSGDVYYQFKTASISIKSSVPDNAVSEDFAFGLSISNSEDQQEVKANLTAFNYPSQIKMTGSKQSLSLPQVGDNKLIRLPVADFFTGSVAQVSIKCPFSSDKTLTLVPPFLPVSNSPGIKEINDIVALPDNSAVLTLFDNALTMTNLDNQVVKVFPIDSKLECRWVEVNGADIVVLCTGSTSQEVAWLRLNEDNTDVISKKTYVLPAEAALQNPFEIACYAKGDMLTVLLHDKVENTYSKDSTVKVMELGDGIEFMGSIDSSWFGVTPLESLNSMSVWGKHMLVTIGGKGLGYANLEDLQTHAQFINLQVQPDIANYTLENSQFVRVSIHSMEGDQVQVFVTTSNSLHYLLSLRVQPSGVIYLGVQQTFNKYGHQVLLNWIQHNDQYVIMAYYNQTTYTESIVLYKRNPSGNSHSHSATKNPVNFMASVQNLVPSSQLHKPHYALLEGPKHQSMVFLESTAGLALYHITGEYWLQATYKQVGNFDSIEVSAQNAYSLASGKVKVEFSGGDKGGLRWYSVVIVICLVVIAVGVAFGLYMRMKARKADSKKVSLFTENEEVDEVI